MMREFQTQFFTTLPLSLSLPLWILSKLFVLSMRPTQEKPSIYKGSAWILDLFRCP